MRPQACPRGAVRSERGRPTPKPPDWSLRRAKPTLRVSLQRQLDVFTHFLVLLRRSDQALDAAVTRTAPARGRRVADTPACTSSGTMTLNALPGNSITSWCKSECATSTAMNQAKLKLQAYKSLQ
jgi:hypothetical protein